MHSKMLLNKNFDAVQTLIIFNGVIQQFQAFKYSSHNMEVLPIDCKEKIASYLFPYVSEGYHYDRSYRDILDDIKGLNALDNDINEIIENTYIKKNQEINEHIKIDKGRHDHYVYMSIYVFENILSRRIGATHSNKGCYICHAELEYSWPSDTSKKHTYAGTCSRECFKKYKEFEVWKNVKEREYKCGWCDNEVFPDDLDNINDGHVWCSSKCREKFERCNEDYYDYDEELHAPWHRIDHMFH